MSSHVPDHFDHRNRRPRRRVLDRAWRTRGGGHGAGAGVGPQAPRGDRRADRLGKRHDLRIACRSVRNARADRSAATARPAGYRDRAARRHPRRRPRSAARRRTAPASTRRSCGQWRHRPKGRRCRSRVGAAFMRRVTSAVARAANWRRQRGADSRAADAIAIDARVGESIGRARNRQSRRRARSRWSRKPSRIDRRHRRRCRHARRSPACRSTWPASAGPIASGAACRRRRW